MNKVLEIQDVSKRYGNKTALDNINVDIDRGQFVALLGQNGAGKTTLFQLLTGLFVPDAGNIYVDGHDMTRFAVNALAGIGVVFQQFTLDVDLTVRANLKLHTRLHGIPNTVANERIEDELERLDLLDCIDETVRNLSGGNKRKVELARSLLHKPHILFMDEASVGLDPVARQSLLNYVYELKDTRQVSVLWATHLVDEVARADQLLVLHKGQLLMSGKPDELIAQSNAESLADAFFDLLTQANDRGVRAS